MNSTTTCAEAYSSSTCEALGLFADMGLLVVYVGLWLLFVSVNDRLIRYVWRGWRDSCGCISKFVWRAPIRAALAAGVNMLFPIAEALFFRPASHRVRTYFGGGPAVAQSPLSALAFVATVAVLARMCAAIYAFLNARDCHNQPCLLETGTQVNDGDNTVDVMVLLEEQPLTTGGAWESGLASALNRQAGWHDH